MHLWIFCSPNICTLFTVFPQVKFLQQTAWTIHHLAFTSWILHLSLSFGATCTVVHVSLNHTSQFPSCHGEICKDTDLFYCNCKQSTHAWKFCFIHGHFWDNECIHVFIGFASALKTKYGLRVMKACLIMLDGSKKHQLLN